MLAIQTSRVRLHPSTAEDRSLVRAELLELLQSPHFTTSKRYPAFLRYVVEKTLEGEADELKERTLGVEVFHRQTDYDTNNDTVVRFAAGEVRKRLALVYHESAYEHTVQIMLSPGSYVPEFLVLAAAEREMATDELPTFEARVPRFEPRLPLSVAANAAAAGRSEPAGRRWRWQSVAGMVALVVAGMLAGVLMRQRWLLRQTALDQFWQPLVGASTPALLSAGALTLSTTMGVVPATKSDEYPYVSMTTATVIAALSDMLGRKNVRYAVMPASATTLTDMREHPVVLIGAYNNVWTPRLASSLRFRFAPQAQVQGQEQGQIYDSTNPARLWERPRAEPYNSGDDYAVVARYRDSLTDSYVVMIAGLGKNGTEAAAQFVMSDRYLQLLNRNPQGKDWATKNVEVVLKTTVIDGKTGSPTVEAAYVW